MASREGRPAVMVEILLASILLVFVVLTGLVALLLGSVNDLSHDSTPGPAAVYIPGGEGSEGVPTYSTPSQATEQGLLPNFAKVEMICWEDAEDRRWFRVLPISQEVPGATVIVQAVHTHNQTRVDSC